MLPWLTPAYLNYRQSVGSKGEGEGKFIHQTGGVAQYAHVKLSVEPLGGTMGIQFSENVTFDGTLPKEYLSYIEMGALVASKKGLWGFPVGGILVYVFGGSYHAEDSSSAAFEKAAEKASEAALLAARPLILEPTVSCTVCVPEGHVAAVLGGLNKRRFRVTKTRKTHLSEIEGIVPQSEVLDLLPHLAARTGGTAYCSMHAEGFEKLPESLTVDRHCSSCGRDMRIPLLNIIPITDKCLICDTPFDSPDFDASVPVLKR